MVYQKRLVVNQYDKVDDLQRVGYSFQVDRLAPCFEFRLPWYGLVNIRDIEEA
jgi:uncharacterized protein (DUF2126 family)